MTREAPKILNADPLPSGTEVHLHWMLPGDTPDKIRILRDLTPIHELDYWVQDYTVTGLPSGTAVTLYVCCVYKDGDLKYSEAKVVQTAGQIPSPSGNQNRLQPPVITSLDARPATL